ncbi:MAG: excinuclease ABC subunit UvrC [Acidobacteria bacterium]|nr:excinuclease ABC subunit UvrC [Acidobacteriota bacterium]
MPIQDLKGQMARLPEQPGVYLYYNEAGDTLYVGKARVLRDRVRSYLGAHGMSPRHDALLDEASRLEFIVTDSVVEALALENHLIKQRAPKYNILLRDDKNYPYLQLTTGEAFPRVLVARRVEKDEHFYAGPFMPAKLGRRTMALTHRLFGIRSCNEVITGERGRPCLEFDIRRCIAPCVRAICSEERYGVAVQHTKWFLEGRNDELVADLKARMSDAARDERFEQAAQLRDAIRTIETVRQRQQKMAGTELGDRDAFGLKVGPAGAVVQVFQVRNGKVVERSELVTDPAHDAAVASEPGSFRLLADDEVLQAALEQFYAEHPAPPEIHVPIELPPADAEVIEAWLTDRSEYRVRLVVPKRGEKRGLLDLAARNAQVAYQTRFNENVAAHYDALETLRAVLNLPSIPRRIECFDISTIQGAETVASMVMCEDGRMKRSEYRKFRIRGAKGERRGAENQDGVAKSETSLPDSVTRTAPTGPTSPVATRPSLLAPRILDDFASMQEVVLRRYKKVVEEGGPFPDLILIDGGKGQLAAAYQALEQLGLSNAVAVGIAKKEELLFTREHVDPIALPAESPALLLIQRIRDEAHRFAVTFHRQSRTKRDLQSALDAIAGIGPRRRKALLTAFGSVAGVRRANREELTAVVGVKCADAVLAYFAAQT